MRTWADRAAVAATLLPAVALAARGLWPAALAVMAVGAVWLALRARPALWIADIALGALVLAAALLARTGAGVLAAAAITLAIVAWDLWRLAITLAAVEVRDPALLTRGHVRRLAIVAGVGFGAAGFASVLRVGMGLPQALLALLLFVIGLLAIIARVR